MGRGCSSLGNLPVSDIKTFPRQCEDLKNSVSQAINSSYEQSTTRVLSDKLALIMEGEKIKVPPLIYATLALSQAFKNEAVDRLPCSTDINLIESEISQTKISGYLRDHINEFYKSCYWPARAKARREGFYPGDGVLPEEIHIWPGHPFFIETQGYYDNADGNGFYAHTAYYGFSNTKNKLAESKNLPAGFGYPTCKEWWLGLSNDPEYGLRQKLYKATPSWVREEEDSFYEYVASWFDSKEEEKSYLDHRDAIVKKVFFSPKDISEYNAANDFGLDKGDTNLVDYTTRMIGTVGLALNAIPNTVGNSMIQLMAPMVKPLVLLVILTAYVPAMLFGAFKVKHVATFISVIASIMFWPFLWELGRIVDDTILDATGGAIFGSMGINQAMLSQYLAGFFFLYGPMLFTAAMGWVGMAGGEMASAKQRVNSSAGSSGQQGATSVKSGGKWAAGKVKQVASKGATK
ncbi:hypothetical protein PSECIP111951_04148 [Pseudoalteromonas holothuriae]|uniref:TraG N-terminal Proteobacteria domain-containing protein n=2 Tax=Pseudoalteromonas holothuriae TaxID=2963714 RepID=A0ABM9GNP4_9GAMM|nr:hypothetical protein PSECIP111951_04148 [Pseudoalteromonas sp. CIP111951]